MPDRVPCVMCPAESLLVRTLETPGDCGRIDVDIPLCARHVVEEPLCDCGEWMSECAHQAKCWVGDVLVSERVGAPGICLRVGGYGAPRWIFDDLGDAWRAAYRIARERAENPLAEVRPDESRFAGPVVHVNPALPRPSPELIRALDEGVRRLGTYRTPDGEVRRVTVDGEGRAVEPVEPFRIGDRVRHALHDSPEGEVTAVFSDRDRVVECWVHWDGGTESISYEPRFLRRLNPSDDASDACTVEDHCQFCEERESECTCEEESASARTLADAEPPGPAPEQLPGDAANESQGRGDAGPGTPAPSGHDYRTAGDVAAERDRDLRAGTWREVTLGEVADAFPGGVYQVLRSDMLGIDVLGDADTSVQFLGTARLPREVLWVIGSGVLARRGCR